MFKITKPATGLRAIDADTEALDFILRRIFDHHVECRRGEKGGCDRTNCTRLSAIIRWLDQSFARQHDFMSEHDYPEAKAHRQDHQRLRNQLATWREQDICAERHQARLRVFVESWLKDHLEQHDGKLAHWAISRRLDLH